VLGLLDPHAASSRTVATPTPAQSLRIVFGCDTDLIMAPMHLALKC
jgi:hypothetical protein